MKLSQAIRLGSKLTKQIQGDLYNKEVNGTCALGAAWVAIKGININADINTYLFLQEVFPILNYSFFNPEESRVYDLQTIIFELNDRYEWTREEIADFVEECEKDVESILQNTENKEDSEEVELDKLRAEYGVF